MFTRIIIIALMMVAVWQPVRATAQTKLDEMSLDRWEKLREVERYQLNIAEKYYKEKKYDVAMSEYEKYLSLYERSDAASFVQLKWSLCLNQLRKQNTAIKEGFQSVIDYWPESVDAPKASYLIGKTYFDIGRLSLGKQSYRQTIADYPKDPVAVTPVGVTVTNSPAAAVPIAPVAESPVTAIVTDSVPVSEKGISEYGATLYAIN